MKTKSLLILTAIVLTALFFCHSASATDKGYGSGIVYGPSAAFIIVAPTGWILDTESGRRYELPAVLYPDGSSFDGPLVMYVNNVEKKYQKAKNLDDFIGEEIHRFRINHPGIEIKDRTSLKISNGKHTVVKEFSGDKWENYEAVAYLEEAKTFTSFTLSSKTKNEYMQSLKAFENFINSYEFITDDINIK